ncbi:hypothetical protein FRC08_008608, partial [Ceratobasidium sp. 394]
MVRVNPHFSHIKPNCTYDYDSPWDIEEDVSAENLRKLEARVEELEGLVNSSNLGDKTRNTQSPSSSGSPPELQPFFIPSPLFDEDGQPDLDFSMGYELPLITDDWPATLPPKQLVLHLVDLFFNCCPNSRRILHRPTFLMQLLEPPSSPRFPFVGLLHSICAAAALHSPFVAVATPPPSARWPTDPIFEEKTHILGNRTLGFDEESFLLAKYECMDFAKKGEYLLEITQACIISCWWAFSCGRWFDVWMMSSLAMRLCVALGLNLCDSIRQPLPDKMREKLLVGPPRSHVEVEQRRNIFWLAYALQRYFFLLTPFPHQISDEDIPQTLPGTLEAFEAGVDDGQDRQTALSTDLFTTHRDNLDDFGLYIKCAIMQSRVHVLQFRHFQQYETKQEVRDSQEMEVMEAVISSMKSSTLKGRF